MSKISRKADLQSEENIANSPLRRSSRISLSAVEATVKPAKTRRSSASSENTDFQEKSDTKPIRGRRGSVVKDEPEMKSMLTRRRSSVTEESQHDTPKSIRNRRTSHNDNSDGKGSNVKAENKKSLSSHGSLSIEIEKESNGKRTVKTRRQSLDLENPPETKRVTRSRRSSVDISDQAEPQTPKITKTKKTCSPLEPLIDKVPIVILTLAKIKPDQEQGDLNLSVIEELSFTEETSKNHNDDKHMAESAEKLTPPKRRSPKLSKDAESSKKLEFTESLEVKNFNLDVEENKKTEKLSVNTVGEVTSPVSKSNKLCEVKLSKDSIDSVNEIRSRHSNSKAQNGGAIDTPASSYLNSSNKDSIPEIEVTDKLPIKSESYEDISSHTTTSTGCCVGEKNVNDSISRETLPDKNESPYKIKVGEDNVGFSQTSNNKKIYSPAIQQNSEEKLNLKDSISPITHKASEDSKEYILNTSTGSNNSDKENICRSDDLASKCEFNINSQGVRVKRISNVFCPKQNDHSFVEQMEIDEESMLNDTRNKPEEDLDETNINPEQSGRLSIDNSIDESFNLCLNVTNAEQNNIFRKSRSENKLNKSGERDFLSQEKIDIEVVELPNENKILESVKEEIQEQTIGKLCVETKLENDIVEVDASSDYEFHLETDEEDLHPEHLKDRKYVESKCRDVSTEVAMTDNTEYNVGDIEGNTETDNNYSNTEDRQDKLDQSFRDDHENNIKIGNINQIENIENMSSTKATHQYTTDIQVKEDKLIKPGRKSPSDITIEKAVSVSDKLVEAEASCSTDQDVSDKKFHVGSGNISNSRVEKNKEMLKEFDLNTVVTSEVNIEISCTGNNVQSNKNKDITIIKSNFNVEDINYSDSGSDLKSRENVSGENNIEHSNTNQIPLRNSTCLSTANNTSEESKSTSDSIVFSTKKEGDFVTNFEDKLIHMKDVNDQSKKQIISNAEECKSDDEYMETENNEIETSEVISVCLKPSKKNNPKKVESPTLSKIVVADSQMDDIISTDSEYSKENFDGRNNTLKLKNNMELDNSKNHNSSTEFEADITDDNLRESGATTPKSSLNNTSKMHLIDSSSQREIKSEQPALNTTETTKVICKDQNKGLISKQGDIDRRNSELDSFLNEEKELNNKIEDHIEMREKANQIRQNLVHENSSIEIGDVSKSKLDAFLDRRLSEMCEESDNNDNFEETNEHNEFIDDMAEEGEEDTPSEDSNQIIDEGESINSTESEIDSDEDYDDNDSFICDEEEIELLSGEEYDLGQENVKRKKQSRIIDVENYENEDVIQIKKKVPQKKGKERKSRIIDVEACDDDVIIVEKVKIKHPEIGKMPTINVKDGDDYTKEEKNKMQHLECTETSNFLKTGGQVMQKEPAYTRKSSITVHENISVTSSTDAILSQRINSFVDSFCSKIQKGDISLNLSLEYDGESKTEDAVMKKNYSDSKAVDRDDKIMAEPPKKKLKVDIDLNNDTNQRPNNFTGNISRKRKKRHQDSDRQLKKIKTKDLRSETFSLMNQLITDVKNRPLRTVKPSTSKADMNNSWIVDIVEIAPSTCGVSKEEIDRYKRKKLHPKDFRQQMLYDSSRIQRMETKTLLKKRGAYK